MNDATIKTVSHRWYYSLLIGIPALLSIITFLVYYQSLWYGFIFDDLPTITNYIHVRYIDFWGQLFANPRWISRLLNQITFHFWKDDPFAYRIFGIIAHITIGIMIFATLLRLFKYSQKYSFLYDHAVAMATVTSMLFLLHPVQTQTVTYITQMRLEGLVTLFMVAIMCAFVFGATRANLHTQKILYIASFIGMVFAAGTKEIVIVLPPLLVLVDWFFIAQGDWTSLKSRWWIHGIYWAVLYGFMLKYGYLQPNFVKTIATVPVHNNRGNILTSAAVENITAYGFAISQFKVFLHYLFMFFWPFGVSFDYDIKLASHWYSPDVIFPALLIVAMIALMVRFYLQGRYQAIVFGFTWFLITMLPRTSIFPTTELICDYKTYPASLGVMMMLAFLIVWGVSSLIQRVRVAEVPQSAFAGSIALVMCIVLAVASNQRSHVWSSELSFWGDVMTKAPKARVMNNYAIALWELGKKEEAVSYFNQAIAKDDWYAEPHVNLATIYQMANENDKAMDHYKRALDIGEAHPELFNNLGMLHFSNRSWAAAEYCLKQAVALRPFYSKTHFNLGKLYQTQNRIEDALRCYENAIKGDKPDAEMYYLHGSLCFEVGRLDQAIASLERLDKNFQDVAFLLGCCYYSKPCYAKAAEYFEFAHHKNPTHGVCVYNYAQTLLNLRKYDLALPLFKQCADAQAFPYARLHSAKCLYETGQKQEAQRALKELAATKPAKEVMRDVLALQKELKLT